MSFIVIFYVYNSISILTVLPNCSLFLVLHVWVSNVTVNVRTSFLVLGGSDNPDNVNTCCNGGYSFLVRLLWYF